MGFVKEIKNRMVQELAEQYKGHENFFLVDYRGLSAKQASDFRKELKAEGVQVTVVKNAIAKFAFKEAGLGPLAEALEGMNAVLYGEDPVIIAKKIHDFIDKNKVLKVRKGLVEGKAVEPAEVKTLSTLPSKEQIQAQLLATMIAPASKFVQTLNEIPGTFLRTLQALKDKKEKEA